MGKVVAFFRPDDERAAEAAEIIHGLGAEPLSDPMLAVEPTGDAPRTGADVTVLTSKTGAELVADAGWTPGGELVAIGTPTAEALTSAGYEVDRLPEEFSSRGLVDELRGDVAGARVEVARSDHGSAVLTEGLNDAGAFVHETVLYRLIRPEGAGSSVEAAVEGNLAGVCFTSSLTVEHFVETAADADCTAEVLEGVNAAIVGAIGEPTSETAARLGIDVDVVPSVATFEALARDVLDRL